MVEVNYRSFMSAQAAVFGCVSLTLLASERLRTGSRFTCKRAERSVSTPPSIYANVRFVWLQCKNLQQTPNPRSISLWILALPSITPSLTRPFLHPRFLCKVSKALSFAGQSFADSESEDTWARGGGATQRYALSTRPTRPSL